jgi:hypothetical protein
MNNMRNQMQASVPGMSAAACERARVVGDIKVQTANMLRAFGRERMAMVKALKSELATDRMNRSCNLLAIRQHTNTMCDGFRRDHRGMRRTLRKSLSESTQSVVNYVATLRVEVAKERASFSTMFDQMSKTQHAALVQDRQLRSHTVDNLIKGFHVTRAAVAQKLADTLSKSTQGIRAQVLDLRCSIAPMLRARAAVVHPAQTAPQMPVSLESQSVAEPFSWPTSHPESKPDNSQAEIRQAKSANVDSGWHNEGKHGKSKKK